jgi:hypothetical protein
MRILAESGNSRVFLTNVVSQLHPEGIILGGLASGKGVMGLYIILQTFCTWWLHES